MAKVPLTKVHGKLRDRFGLSLSIYMEVISKTSPEQNYISSTPPFCKTSPEYNFILGVEEILFLSVFKLFCVQIKFDGLPKKRYENR